ncbi:putative peptidoglycan-binding peptidase [Escherichia coli]|uniref:Putative peptidoglycan-binding peptidase n=1 Tax=Escherichia coli TaxID=562 RepID=A0A376DL29_ECOLX|nr:putative peptidoglycan-binding peptidase [Escherichia coli]
MQQIARSVALAFNNLPRPHRVMLGSLTVLTLAVAVWRPYVYHRDATPIVKTIELEQNEIRSLLPEASEPIDQAAQEDEAIPQDELDDKIAGEAGVHEYVVSTGDTLSSILNQYGIDMGDITQLAAADKELRNLKIGQQLSWTLTADGELQRLTWEVSRRETRTYDRTAANGFKMTSEMQQGEWVNNLLKGTVGGSFVASARNAGLTSAEVSAVIKAMQWQMDFRKLKKGDEFAVLMSREMLDGNVSKASCWAYVCVQKVKIITQSALKMANSTIVTVLVWRKDSCDSRRRNSSVSHLTLTRVVLIR